SEYRIIKLRVVESIRGSGLPEEIFLRFGFRGWKDPTVFEGYDRFILSLQQVGIENYMMVNDSARKIEYFPNMFEGASGSIKGGCVIAFNDGVLDERYWKEMYTIDKYPTCVESKLDAPNSGYPATRNSTIQEVKAKIRSLVEENKGVYARRYDYLRAEDLFLSKEAKEAGAYVAPGKNNVFAQTLTVGKEEVNIEYTRVINGFETNEVICVNGYERGQGSVTRTGESFTEADFESIPNLGEVLGNITFFDLGEFWPANVSLSEFRLRRVSARGFYCKAGGVAYGFVRVSWYYDHSVKDISYYLCDENGKGTIIEKEELKELIGAQAYNELFPYDD
ncbi:MAG: hypothetical protein IJZ37_00895, partial [Clostridia bacterium]|nr:hypothetical protein [Clostridia bacterium]